MSWSFFEWSDSRGETHTDFCVTCRNCSSKHTFQANNEDVDAWRDEEKLIQDAFPYLDPFQRELLLSGLCEECWKKLYT